MALCIAVGMYAAMAALQALLAALALAFLIGAIGGHPGDSLARQAGVVAALGGAVVLVQVVATCLVVPRVGPPGRRVSRGAALVLALLLGPLPLGLWSAHTAGAAKARAAEREAKARRELAEEERRRDEEAQAEAEHQRRVAADRAQLEQRLQDAREEAKRPPPRR
jgi:Sec-independent protein translocase protein TatA